MESIFLFIFSALLSTTSGFFIRNECDCGRENIPINRIINGNETTPNKYPWIVQLYYVDHGKVGCAGSILDEYHVLTAAHCLIMNGKDLKPEEIHIFTGVHERGVCGDGCGEYKVSDIFIEPNYKRKEIGRQTGFGFDIAIIRLMKPINFSKIVKKACLPSDDKQYKMLTVAGWGALNERNKLFDPDHEFPEKLQEANIDVITHDECKDFWKEWFMTHNHGNDGRKVSLNVICSLSPKRDTGACKGDSGSPLMHRTPERTYVTGVVSGSWSIFCSKTPIFSTKVHSNLNFIRKHAPGSCVL